MEILSMILTWALVWAIGALILVLVSRLGLGLSVDGFGPAFIASAVISLVSWAITWLLGLIGVAVGGSGLIGALVTLVVAAVVLMISASFVKGVRTNGFVGALIAAVAYGVIAWLLQWVLGLFM